MDILKLYWKGTKTKLTESDSLLLVLIVLPLISCMAQVPIPVNNELQDQTSKFRQAILGAWFNDDGNVKRTYTADGVSKVYYEGILEDSYTWIITTAYTLSGLTSSNLIISNENETYRYEIDTISDSKMI